jgi:hypothetical protein
MPLSRPAAGTAATAGGNAGATASALLCFVSVSLPATVLAFKSAKSAFVVGWLPLILAATLPWTAAAALLGYVAGRIAAHARNVWSGALVGVVISVAVSATVILLFVSRAEAQQVHTPARLLLLAGSMGALTGGIAWRVANRQRNPDRSAFQVSLSEMLLLIAAIAACLAAYTM